MSTLVFVFKSPYVMSFSS